MIYITGYDNEGKSMDLTGWDLVTVIALFDQLLMR